MQVIAPDLGIRNRPETKLLIHPTGADQSQVITDASFGGPKTITVAGNAKIVAQDLRHPYARSAAYFPGASKLSCADNADLRLGNQNFVIEGWINQGQVVSSPLICAKASSGALSYAFAKYDATYMAFLWSTDGATWGQYVTFPWQPTIGKHQFIALSRSGNILRFYAEGEKKGTDQACSATFLANAGAFDIGKYFTTSFSDFIGSMIDFRVSVGTDRGYTGTTIPVPTAPLPSDSYTKLLIRGDNITQPTTFKDISPSPKTITATGSVQTVPLPPGPSAAYFDGSGDDLITPSSSDFNFGTGDFTIHFWANPSSLDASHGVFAMFNDANNDFQISIRNGPPFWLRIYAWASGSCVLNVNTPASSIPDNTWSHVAIVRYGAGQNNLAISINGKFQALTWGVNMPAGYTMPNYSNIVIGADTANADYMTGFLKEFTVARRALWTHDFTPPARAA